MAKSIIKDARVFSDSRNISGILNQVTLGYEAAAQDATDITQSTIERLSGLEDFSLDITGFSDADTDDAAFFSNVGSSKVPVTVIPVGAGANGEVAFFSEAPFFTYNLDHQVGELYSFTGGFQGADRLIQGQVAENTTTDGVGSDTSSGIELGAVSSSQSLYATIHVVSLTGTGSLQVRVESDVDNTFSSPTTRLNFFGGSAISTVDSEFLSTQGAITDTWFRVWWQVGGSAPADTFTFIVSFGIK